MVLVYRISNAGVSNRLLAFFFPPWVVFRHGLFKCVRLCSVVLLPPPSPEFALLNMHGFCQDFLSIVFKRWFFEWILPLRFFSNFFECPVFGGFPWRERVYKNVETELVDWKPPPASFLWICFGGMVPPTKGTNLITNITSKQACSIKFWLHSKNSRTQGCRWLLNYWQISVPNPTC